MSSADDTCDATSGNLITVPDARHSLHALRDTVVLLSVAKLS